MQSTKEKYEASWRDWVNKSTKDDSERPDDEGQGLLSTAGIENQTRKKGLSTPFWVILCGVLLVAIIFQNVMWIAYISDLKDRPPAHSKGTNTATTPRSWLREEADNGISFSRPEECQGSNPRWWHG
jgi:hypothetical protein